MSRNVSQTLILREFQSETDAIREMTLSSAPRYGIWLLAMMLGIGVLVTIFIPVDRVVTSESGTIVPTSAVNVFQALDASIIKSIDVKEGQTVEAGQLLATLDQTFAAADVGQLKQQLSGLDAQIARAEAELAGRAPSFISASDLGPYASIQRALFFQRSAQYSAQLASFAEKISETQATIIKYQNDESRYSEREKISKQIEDMRSLLAEHQVGSLLNLYSAQDTRLELLRTMEAEHNSLIGSQHLLASLRQDQEAFKQQWAASLSQEVVTAHNARDQAQSAFTKASRHQALVILRAPEEGVVLTIAKLSVGAVLKEGDSLMTVMPTRTPMEADVHIASRDVGFLKRADKATLKIDAFNPSEHGTAEGHVDWISDGAFTVDDTGKPVDAFYKVRIAIDAFHFSGVPQNFRLIPGMTLIADINVGTRSLARYIFGGVLRGVGEAMREP